MSIDLDLAKTQLAGLVQNGLLTQQSLLSLVNDVSIHAEGNITVFYSGYIVMEEIKNPA